jgi:hypothetical protein
MSHRPVEQKAQAREARAACKKASKRLILQDRTRWGVHISNSGRRYYRVSWSKAFPFFWGSRFPNMRPGRTLSVLPNRLSAR